MPEIRLGVAESVRHEACLPNNRRRTEMQKQSLQLVIWSYLFTAITGILNGSGHAGSFN